MINMNLCYYPDITQYRSAADIKRAVEVFANHLSAEYSNYIGQQVAIKVLPVMDVRTKPILWLTHNKEPA